MSHVLSLADGRGYPCANDAIASRAVSAAVAMFLIMRWPDALRHHSKTYNDHKCRLSAFGQFATMRQVPDTCEEATDLIQEYLNYRLFRGYTPCGVDNDRRVLSALWSWMVAGLAIFSLCVLAMDMNMRALPLTK